MANEAKQRTEPGTDGDLSAPRALEQLVHEAHRVGASDIHFQMDGREALVSFRLDGLITPSRKLPRPLAERVLGRIKYLAKLKTYQESLPQDGRIEREAFGLDTDLRVATYPTITGEKAVLRLFHQGESHTLDTIGFPAPCQTVIRQVLQRSSGLMLLTGPSGSGKTTTIYACLRYMAQEQSGRHIITIEDPAEQRIAGVMQTEVNEARGLNFARAARHLLRQDPQVLVIGEVRDEETAGIAVRAALTGHLVITTLHAGSCRGVFDRLSTLCPDRSAIAAGTLLVINQRLLRTCCVACEGAGCRDCLDTGYRGRAAAVEWLPIDDTRRDLLRSGRFESITPMMTLRETADELAASRMTTDLEVDRVLGE
jgi:type II secretory ATPase GspE/PulE/Tfp pilus assembly ATPase PilB-like protein